LTTHDEKMVGPEEIKQCLESLRKVQTEGQVTLKTRMLYFETGQELLDWVEEVKTALQPGEIKQ